MSGADSRNTAGRSNNEYYEITLAADGIAVRGVSKDAVLNGVKTLARLAERNAGSPEVACATICDWPDLHYRGLMLDVVRDYSQLSDVKRLIDRLAIYKINRLQFHLTDDEGWRIEIPGLPELTDVGSRRGMTEKNPASSSSRMPATETPTTCRPHQTDIFPKPILWNFYAMPMHAEWK